MELKITQSITYNTSDYVLFLKSLATLDLTEKEILLLDVLIKKYLSLKKNQKEIDLTVINSQLFSTENKKNIQKILNIKPNYLDVLFNSLRKKRIIKEKNILNEKIIPKFDNNGNYSLLIKFKNE